MDDVPALLLERSRFREYLKRGFGPDSGHSVGEFHVRSSVRL
jgi:hypothetical protein